MALDVSELIAAQMAGRTLRFSVLVHFDFLSGARRVWPGKGALVSGGYTWDGLDLPIVGVDVGKPSEAGAAEAFSIGLSGVDPGFRTRALASESEAIGRPIGLFLQFFGSDWQPMDAPISLRQGRMVGFQMAGVGVESRSITVRCEGRLTARGRPPLTYLSDSEQQARYPGDLGLQYVPSLQQQTVVWPK